MIKLYKDGDSMAIVTDADTEEIFIQQLSDTLGAAIDANIHQFDWPFQFGYWLPQIVDICCKYRGYKNQVHEKRLLCAGSFDLLPTCKLEVIYENGHAEVISETEMAKDA